MSLKGFHVVFVTLATLCLLGFAVWSFLSGEGGLLTKVVGACSAALGVLLASYGAWFYRNKLKNSTF